jgi:hypothetical protein
MVYPLVKHCFESTISSAGRSKGTGMNPQGYRLDKHPLSIPHDTRWGSDGQIVSGSGAKTISSGEELSPPVQIEDRQQPRDVDVGKGSCEVWQWQLGQEQVVRQESDCGDSDLHSRGKR